MLLLGSRLIDMPIMSLQTGAKIGVTKSAIASPDNLSILAYRIESALLPVDKSHYIRLQDVRELSDIGLIIDSIDELVATGDVIRLDETVELNFMLNGMKVMDETGHKIGRVEDFTLDTISFMVQQLSVKQPLLKRLNNMELLVHRSQIIEINDEGIVIHSHAKVPEHTKLTAPGAHSNPFRKTNPAAQNTDLN